MTFTSMEVQERDSQITNLIRLWLQKRHATLSSTVHVVIFKFIIQLLESFTLPRVMFLFSIGRLTLIPRTTSIIQGFSLRVLARFLKSVTTTSLTFWSMRTPTQLPITLGSIKQHTRYVVHCYFLVFR